jgi:transcriptional regulator with XRE-family HTH domain
MVKEGKKQENIQAIVGSNIEHFRLLKKKTPKDMATVLNITEVAYRNIERGLSEISLTKIMQIAELLQIHYSQILEIDSKQTFNYTNTGTGTANMFAHSTYNFAEEGYKLCIAQYKEEIKFLKKQVTDLTASVKNNKK